jgi:heme exporter protein B
VRHVAALVWKDLLIELRSREMLIGTAVFSLLVLLVFNFAFDLRGERARAAIPGMLWVTVLFAAMLGMARAFQSELENGALDGLLVSPVDRGTLYLGKLAVNLVFTIGVALLALVALGFVLNVATVGPATVAVVALGTTGLVAVSTVLAAVTARTRARELLLPLLALPLLVPMLIGGVEALAVALATVAEAAARPPWLGLLAAFDVIFIAVGYLAFEYVIED